ncbi:hypothetical protein PC41400_15020 [Paenibacillus chitinolyticus]|uniref:Uncharacterized protein n=1 Tax=Paenibacillus chitinolyticus TaxID=79263 RepID=A0A410WXB3_9BACL|nr:hypothetical protein [Paenibacillus chitinolyticus]MCY9592345.1 hypothetical protein [Paenibacillus chitinolyticus]MCY9599807.1 hypothetical protein [Paenibacillus chitinolyticus]QAV18917.1 hypothetical protein PC41400_15020 [Paenibacillus chitinolyticus]
MIEISQLVGVNSFDEATHISVDKDLSNITKDKIYELYVGKPIGISCGEDEHYIIDDNGERMHGVWAFIKTKYYKQNNT